MLPSRAEVHHKDDWIHFKSLVITIRQDGDKFWNGITKSEKKQELENKT